MTAPSEPLVKTYAISGAGNPAADPLTATFYYSSITVENGTTDAIQVVTQGSTQATATTGFEVPAGATLVFPNGDALPNPNNPAAQTAKYSAGVTGVADQSEAVAWTAQNGWVGDGTHTQTYVSVYAVGSASSGNVTLTCS